MVLGFESLAGSKKCEAVFVTESLVGCPTPYKVATMVSIPALSPNAHRPRKGPVFFVSQKLPSRGCRCHAPLGECTERAHNIACKLAGIYYILLGTTYLHMRLFQLIVVCFVGLLITV